MSHNTETGTEGENKAAEYLARKGFQILHRNWRIYRFEIDIVALDGETLVFVEVKSRRGVTRGEPIEAVNIKKQKQIIKAANFYFREYNRTELSRFDIVGICIRPGEELEIVHLKDAFYPT